MTTDNSHTLPVGQTESIKSGNLLINFTTEFHRIWDSRGSDSAPGSFWRLAPDPDALPGYFPLGDIVVRGYDNVNGSKIVAVVREGDETPAGKALSRPIDYEKVWRDSSSGAAADCTVWRPIPPSGYVALGVVCSNGRDKPLLNTVRCVRSDLVVAANLGDLIWSDKGSGARQNFSAWHIDPPPAQPGEIYFSPGSFFAVQSHGKPATPVSYVLRMQIPRQVNPAPEPPELSGYEAPSAVEPARVTQVARLPWFAVRENLQPTEQLRTSPFYCLERTDQYVLVGHTYNTGDQCRPAKWKAFPVQNPIMQQIFSSLTSIRIDTAWPANAVNNARAIEFSACLQEDFTHTEHSTGGWNELRPLGVIAMAAKCKAVAVYQIQSDYMLKRADGTKVAVSIGYSDDESLHLSEYPQEVDTPAMLAPASSTALVKGLDHDAVGILVESPPVSDLPPSIDSAP
ncbi:Vps62-related protein [Pseudomonas sp. HS6]|uniref:Vps62-related protein n=1 Tax=Pseudomonas sp. HS6 TaxID=2850559 RepID=UPI0020189B08|nr:Vps62-related protein [Pseudomonas sp. HS6]UQS14486.1 Vps62-related protein [Pseudomonas sp. HS6]